MPARWPRGLLLAYAAINVLVLVNAVTHHYAVGYDAEGHQQYVRVLAGGRLPTLADTEEYFNAPLPYLPPALAAAFLPDVSMGAVMKGAQVLQAGYSLVLTWALVGLCRRLRPDEPGLPAAALCLLGLLPVYYRTMAMFRGEALTACLTVLCLERALAFSDDSRPSRALTLGGLLGLLLLSKQWGVFVVAAIVLWLVARMARAGGTRLRAVALAVAVAAATGGWYYATLQWRFGSVAAFNAPAVPGWSLSAKPPGFLTSLRAGQVFREPIRPAFAPEPLLPTFYADTWGDYWCYWLVYGNTRVDDPAQPPLPAPEGAVTNRAAMDRYLGRVNAVAVVPSAALLAGLVIAVLGVVRTRVTAWGPDALLGLTIGISLAGFVFLLLRYPFLDVKVSYLLHVFPLVAALAGAALCALRRAARPAFLAALVLLSVAAAHNAGTLISRYPQWAPERAGLAGSASGWGVSRRVH